jgi:hypothetical protein
MIHLAVPIAYAVLALVAWRYDARSRRAYEATLSASEKRQFRALRRIDPLTCRAISALRQAEAAAIRDRRIRHGADDILYKRPD